MICQSHQAALPYVYKLCTLFDLFDPVYQARVVTNISSANVLHKYAGPNGDSSK